MQQRYIKFYRYKMTAEGGRGRERIPGGGGGGGGGSHVKNSRCVTSAQGGTRGYIRQHSRES